MQYRRIRTDAPTGLGPVILTGLGVGIGLGFLLGELFAGQGAAAAARSLFPSSKNALRLNQEALVKRVLEAVRPVVGTDADSLEIRAVAPRTLEIQGWVTSRRNRARTIGLARETLGPDYHVVDRLLVWGEDPMPTDEFPIFEEA